MSSHDKESEVAEGWYVVLTPKRKEQIKKLGTELVLKKKLKEIGFTNNGRHRNSVLKFR